MGVPWVFLSWGARKAPAAPRPREGGRFGHESALLADRPWFPLGGELGSHKEARCHRSSTAWDQGWGLGTAGAPGSVQTHPCTGFARAQQAQHAYGSRHFVSSDQHIWTGTAQEKQKLDCDLLQIFSYSCSTPTSPHISTSHLLYVPSGCTHVSHDLPSQARADTKPHLCFQSVGGKKHCCLFHNIQ